MADARRTWSDALPPGHHYSFRSTWKEGGFSLDPALVDLLWLLDGSGVVFSWCDPSAFLLIGPWRIEQEGDGLSVTGSDRRGESYHFPDPSFAADFLMSRPECCEVTGGEME